MKWEKSTDEYLLEMGYSLFEEYEKAVRLAAIPTEDWVFDAATGSARMTRVLLEKGYQIISGDIKREKFDALIYSPPFFESQKIHWIQLDLYQLCFRDQQVDNIICANLFHEVCYPKSVLSELLRIFSGKGKMVLLDFTEQGFLIIDAIQRKRHGKKHGIKAIISCDEIKSFLEDRMFYVQELHLPLNWVYVAEGKK